MPDTVHTYVARVVWTGNRGTGTTNRRAYSRDTETSAGAKPLPAAALHADAHAMCFIARSVNFPVDHQPSIIVSPWAGATRGACDRRPRQPCSRRGRLLVSHRSAWSYEVSN